MMILPSFITVTTTTSVLLAMRKCPDLPQMHTSKVAVLAVLADTVKGVVWDFNLQTVYDCTSLLYWA